MNKQETKAEPSLAWRMIKGLFATLITVIFLWFGTIVGFVWYLNQYDFSTTTTHTTIDGAENGNANYIKGKGDIINGEDRRNNNNENKNKEN